MNWQKVLAFFTYGVAVAGSVAPKLGSEGHAQAANDALDTAHSAAQQVLTDPEQKNEAAMAYTAAKGLIGLITALTAKKS